MIKHLTKDSTLNTDTKRTVEEKDYAVRWKPQK